MPQGSPTNNQQQPGSQQPAPQAAPQQPAAQPQPATQQPQPQQQPAQQQPMPRQPQQSPQQQQQQPPQQKQAKSQQQQEEQPQQKPNSTQNSLLLAELRDQMAIMSDGSFRAVITCKSINFDLMSEREREGVEHSYQSFLNSLFFPIQILIRSQRIDIGPYLEQLRKLRRSQDNMLLGVLMDDYVQYIAELSEASNIMDKSFFIVVPYFPSGDFSSSVGSSKNLLRNLFATQQKGAVHINQTDYEKARDEIKKRVDVVIDGLYQIGIQAVQLNTKELGELYYNVYNPDTAVREPLGNFEELTGTYVGKGEGQAERPYINKETQ